MSDENVIFNADISTNFTDINKTFLKIRDIYDKC